MKTDKALRVLIIAHKALINFRDGHREWELDYPINETLTNLQAVIEDLDAYVGPAADEKEFPVVIVYAPQPETVFRCHTVAQAEKWIEGREAMSPLEAARVKAGDYGIDAPEEDGTSGQDRENYTDDQDRDSYDVEDSA